MRDIDTIEKQIVYAQSLVENIKTRQNIIGSKLQLVETLGFSDSGVVNDFTTRKYRIVFTPILVNGYAELGVSTNTTSVRLEIYSDPAYASSTTQQGWVLVFTNTTGSNFTVNLSAGVVSMTTGTITGGWI
jgi:hypothetical protein